MTWIQGNQYRSLAGRRDSEAIWGVVTRIRFQGPNGFMVADVNLGAIDPSTPGRCAHFGRVVGTAPHVRTGHVIQAKGRWRRHKIYGRQFMATRIECLPMPSYRPHEWQRFERYRALLSSRVIPGIGSRTADRIIGAFGIETPTVLCHDIDRLLDVHGFGQAMVAKIRKGLATHRAALALMREAQRCGVPAATVLAWYRRTGPVFARLAVTQLRQTCTTRSARCATTFRTVLLGLEPEEMDSWDLMSFPALAVAPRVAPTANRRRRPRLPSRGQRMGNNPRSTVPSHRARSRADGV